MSAATWAQGFAAGAAVIYLLDPQQGRRRRALLRDQTIHASHKLREAGGKLSRDASNRVQGLVAETRSHLLPQRTSDDILIERVRSRIGRCARHPSSIHVTAEQGAVTLEGLILADEVQRVVRAVEGVPGVTMVHNRLDVHAEPGNHPELQGAGRVVEPGFDLAQAHWAPTTRFVVGTVGAMWVLYGISHPSPIKRAAGCAGFGLLARAIFNVPVSTAVGWAAAPDVA